MGSVFVGILNYNRADGALRCRESVLRSGGVEVRCTIADNASTDDSVAVLTTAIGSGGVLVNRENRGYAGGMNALLRHWLEVDGSPKALLLTEDMELEPETVARLVEAMDADGSIGLAGPVVRRRGGGIMSAGGRVDARRVRVGQILEPVATAVYPVDWIDGCCMLVRREAIEAVGGFDDRYFIYFEENDLCQRIRKVGWRVCVVPEAQASQERPVVQADRYFYLMARNRYLYWQKNFRVPAWRVTLALGWETARMAAWTLRGLLSRAGRDDLPRRMLYLRRQLRGVAKGVRDHRRGAYGVTPAALE